MGGIFGGGGSGGNTSTSTSTNAPPAWLQTELQNLGTQAQAASKKPLQQYGGSMVAGFTPDQKQAMSTIDNAQGMAQPYYNQAAQFFQNATNPLAPTVQPYVDQSMSTIGSAMGQLDPSNISKYMSPYTQQVVDKTQAQFNNANAQQNQQLVGSAIQSGAWGGDRASVAQGILGGQQQLAQAPTIANLYNQGWTNAGQLATSAGQQQLAGAQQQLANGNTILGANQANAWLNSQVGAGMMGLGTQAENQALQGASAQLQSGALQQQLGQEQLNVPYEQFLQQQAYPYQQLSWLSGVENGLGTTAGGTSTSTGTTPSASSASQAAGAGLAGIGMIGQGVGGLNSAMNSPGGFFGYTSFQRGGIVPHRANGGPSAVSPADVHRAFQQAPVQASIIDPSQADALSPNAPNAMISPDSSFDPAGGGMAQPGQALTGGNPSYNMIKNPGSTTTQTTSGGGGGGLFGGLMHGASAIMGASGAGSAGASSAADAAPMLMMAADGGVIPHRAAGGSFDPLAMSEKLPLVGNFISLGDHISQDKWGDAGLDVLKIIPQFLGMADGGAVGHRSPGGVGLSLHQADNGTSPAVPQYNSDIWTKTASNIANASGGEGDMGTMLNPLKQLPISGVKDTGVSAPSLPQATSSAAADTAAMALMKAGAPDKNGNLSGVTFGKVSANNPYGLGQSDYMQWLGAGNNTQGVPMANWMSQVGNVDNTVFNQQTGQYQQSKVQPATPVPGKTWDPVNGSWVADGSYTPGNPNAVSTGNGGSSNGESVGKPNYWHQGMEFDPARQAYVEPGMTEAEMGLASGGIIPHLADGGPSDRNPEERAPLPDWTKSDLAPVIIETAKKYPNITPDLLGRTIMQESGGQPVSGGQYTGIAQFDPETARSRGLDPVKLANDRNYSVDAAGAYLHDLTDRHLKAGAPLPIAQGHAYLNYNGAKEGDPSTLAQGNYRNVIGRAYSDDFPSAGGQATAASGVIPAVTKPDSEGTQVAGFSPSSIAERTDPTKAGYTPMSPAHTPDMAKYDAIQHPEADPWQSLMAAGFAMMAGRSPHALTNIGEGALAGMANYSQQKADASKRAQEGFSAEQRADEMLNAREQTDAQLKQHYSQLAEQSAAHQDQTQMLMSGMRDPVIRKAQYYMQMVNPATGQNYTQEEAVRLATTTNQSNNAGFNSPFGAPNPPTVPNAPAAGGTSSTPGTTPSVPSVAPAPTPTPAPTVTGRAADIIAKDRQVPGTLLNAVPSDDIPVPSASDPAPVKTTRLQAITKNQTANEAYEKGLTPLASAADSTIAQITQMKSTLENDLQTGALLPVSSHIAAAVYAMTGDMGLAQSVSGVNLADSEIFQKDASQMGLLFARQTEGAREAVAAIKIALGAYPEGTKSREGNIAIINSLEAAARHTRDMTTYWEAFHHKNPNQSHAAFEAWWNQEHPLTEYVSAVVPMKLPLVRDPNTLKPVLDKEGHPQMDTTAFRRNHTYQGTHPDTGKPIKFLWDGQQAVMQ